MDGIFPKEDWKIGVDIGGTFVDFCALEARSGRVVSLKVLTTPDDPGAELSTGLDLLASREGLTPNAVSRFVHGTTVGINTVIQRKGAKLALFTNAGFEDVIELARLRMPEMYSLFCHRPDPLISRDLIFGLPVRMTADGSRIEQFDTLEETVQKARDCGAEGIIVALLHSWRDAGQEADISARIKQLAPDLFVFTSAEVWPVIREYERFSTAILNGYVHPRVSGYLQELETRIADQGIIAPPLLTKSNGGLMTAGEGRRDCVSMLLSGTASGVIGAAWLARQANEPRVLTLDIGGTSADFALIIDGEVQFGSDELVGEFPLHIPSVSVSSIGIGGGSIASVDAHGVLRVGPQSAGSRPGPACYGQGGQHATVTDAMVVCGWLGHSEMAYGQLNMRLDLARQAVSLLAEDLGRSPEETAQAIIDIAVSEMYVEVEKLCSRAGVDLRDFTLMPFGGGGPMLGAFLAKELGMPRVMAPRRPGVVSALGGLVADLRGDFIRTVFTELTLPALTELQSHFRALSEEGREWLKAQGHESAVDLRLSADMRYAGQSYEIEVVLKPDWLSDRSRIADAFHAAHKGIYDFHDLDGQIEMVNLRLSAVGDGPKPELAELTQAETTSERDVAVYIGDWRQISLHQRGGLASGDSFAGPAIVAQEDTTFVVPAGAQARVDARLNIHLDLTERK